jgi:2'-5' RNA ligase
LRSKPFTPHLTITKKRKERELDEDAKEGKKIVT